MITSTVAPYQPANHPPGVPGDECVRVLIADHDDLARCMLHNAVQAGGAVTIPPACDAREALELVRYYRPPVVIVDTALPPDGCVELIRKVLPVAPATRVLTISAGDDETALAALRAGAVGHISKDVDPGELVRMVAGIAHGEAIVPPRLIKPLLGLLREAPDATWRPLHSRLTTREWEIVGLLSEGRSTDQIAERLMLSPKTVYGHVRSVLRKLNVHSRPDAVAAAECLRKEEALVGTNPALLH